MKAYKEVITESKWGTSGWEYQDSVYDVNDLMLDESEVAHCYDGKIDWSWYFEKMDRNELADGEDIKITCRIYDADDMENAIAETSIWASDYNAE